MNLFVSTQTQQNTWILSTNESGVLFVKNDIPTDPYIEQVVWLLKLDNDLPSYQEPIVLPLDSSTDPYITNVEWLLKLDNDLPTYNAPQLPSTDITPDPYITNVEWLLKLDNSTINGV